MKRIPTRGILAGCCAPAIRARVKSATTIRIDDTAAFFIVRISFQALFITLSRAKKSVILRAESEGVSLREETQLFLRLD
jgi:hypothetical protein